MPIRRLHARKEGNDRYDKIMSAFADYRAAMAADIAIVKTLAETNTAALASAENRLAPAIKQYKCPALAS